MRKRNRPDHSPLVSLLTGKKTRSAYGELPKHYPLHYRVFRTMHSHANKRGYPISEFFEKSGYGLINFIESIGEPRTDEGSPMLIRKQVRKGFVKGNLAWCEKSAGRSHNTKQTHFV